MADKAYRVSLGGTAVDEDFYGDVQALVVEENTAAASTLRLRLAIRLNEDGSWTYMDDDRLALLNAVKVEIGFTGGGGLAGLLGGLAGGNDGLEPVFDGYITGVNVSLGSEPGQSTLEVMALDTCVLLSLEEKIASWPNLSDSDIVQQIVSSYGIEVQADSTPTVHSETNTTIMQRATDIQFVRMLAERNGFEFYFQTDKASGQVTAYFRAPQLDGTPQPDLAIQFGEESNLRSFNVQVTAQRPLNVKVEQIDVKENAGNSAQVANSELAVLGAQDLLALAGEALGQLVTPRDALAQMLLLGPPTSDATELHTMAQAVRDEAAWFVAAEGEINSEAYGAVLRPHRLVLVKGAGTAYSGKYYVTSVVQELGGDGSYRQTFAARRNARGLDGSEHFGGNGLGLPLPGI